MCIILLFLFLINLYMLNSTKTQHHAYQNQSQWILIEFCAFEKIILKVVSRYRVSSRNTRGSVLVVSYISQIVLRWRKWFDNELTAVPCPDGSAAVDLDWKRRGAKLEHKIRSAGFPAARGWRKIVRLNYVAEKARKRARDVILPAKSGLGRRKSAQGRSFLALRHVHKSLTIEQNEFSFSLIRRIAQNRIWNILKNR